MSDNLRRLNAIEDLRSLYRERDAALRRHAAMVVEDCPVNAPLSSVVDALYDRQPLADVDRRIEVAWQRLIEVTGARV